MAVTTNTRKLAALLGASGAGIGTDGLLQAAAVDANIATQAELDAADNRSTTNLAVLAIRQAADHNDVKYSLQDRIIDDYYDASGIDATPSTNHTLASGAYSGTALATPTITHDADATGTDGDYTWYKWTDTAATGSYSTDTAQTHEFLVVAGGGGGGGTRGGGGGAGGLRSSYGSVSGGGASAQADLALGTSPTYTITVGAGGGGGAVTGPSNSWGQSGTAGSPSSITGSDITDVVTVGGGYATGNSSGDVAPGNGGSGGGLTDNQAGNNNGGTGTAGEGYAGSGTATGSSSGGGGAAGVGGAGSPSTGGAGGIGLDITITGASVGYAGGGGGGMAVGDSAGAVTHGGGAGSTSGSGNAGTVNTGGGGGGAFDGNNNTGGAGGSGVVILRRPTTVTAIGDLILQSTDTTAETEADFADMVTLIEDTGGTPATINTDIKGYISEDSGVTFTQGTLVDEGDWGTNKRILAFHDLDISAQSGTAMCYKITTHNQTASKTTKIHATSIGWR